MRIPRVYTFGCAVARPTSTNCCSLLTDGGTRGHQDEQGRARRGKTKNSKEQKEPQEQKLFALGVFNSVEPRTNENLNNQQYKKNISGCEELRWAREPRSFPPGVNNPVEPVLACEQLREGFNQGGGSWAFRVVAAALFSCVFRCGFVRFFCHHKVF